MKRNNNLSIQIYDVINFKPMDALQIIQMLFLFILTVQSSFSAQSLNSTIERSALLHLRSSLSIRAKHWPLKADPCFSWTGITCQNGRVTSINLSGLTRTHIGRLSPKFSVDGLANLTKLNSFNSTGFDLPGSIPDWFGSRLHTLQVLDLRCSSVSGSIPVSFWNLSSLHSLCLSDNLLTGAIPASLGRLFGLKSVDFSNNLLTGTVPEVISELRNLTVLDLSWNYLSGSIPASIGNLSRLERLNLSSNSFTSEFPFLQLSQLVELDVGFNYLTGSLPNDFRKRLNSLQKLIIGNNYLEGQLPANLFQNLSELDVSSNNFTGNLPKLSLMVNGDDRLFNLSNNLFYGLLLSPLLLESGVIDLSNNYLQGKVPNDAKGNVDITNNCLQSLMTQRSLSDCKLFYEERGLIFDNFGAQNRPESQLPESKSTSGKNNTKIIFILGGVLGGVIFLVLLVVFLVLITRACKKIVTIQRGRNANVGPIPEAVNVPKDSTTMNLLGCGESYTYEQMVQYTANFSETKLIKHGHSGDLFQGTSERGAQVVIKRVDLLSFKKEAYETELEFFNKVLHTRFVPLLGHCLEKENDKFLVYKNMPKGDLCKSFYRPENTVDDCVPSLDWITRLKIAIGTAEGLTYLHHECNPPLVHRDIQSSSILLDDKFDVRLGSLSEVHAQQGDQSVITRLLKNPSNSEQYPLGSSPPNSCAYDVYCFGKILLELVTGKLGMSKSDDTTLKEWLEHTLPYISIQNKEMVTKIIDPSLIIDEDLLEEVWAMSIVARSCLNPKPSKRPAMKYILKALENPLKVVRLDHSSSSRLRTTSSRRSWSAALFGSWRQSSSESACASYQTNREGGISGLNEMPSSRNRLSSEIFPEPVQLQDA